MSSMSSSSTGLKLEDLEAEFNIDSVFDTVMIERTAVNIPVVYSKWLGYRNQVKLLQIKQIKELKEIEYDRFLFYTGRHDDDVCNHIIEKSEMKYVLSGDPLILKEQL